MPPRPVCGGSPTVAPAPSLIATILGIISIASAISAVIVSVEKIGEGLSAVGTFIADKVTSLFSSITLSPNGALALLAIIAVAVVTAIVIIIWAWESYNALCGSPPFGRLACITGVINSVTPGFSSWYSEAVGFANNQPQIDVVVKSDYWSIVTLNSPPFVWCAGCQNCLPAIAGAFATSGGTPPCSPELICYYHNRQVCNAALGSAIGATVGAAIGAVVGIIGAVAAMSALGCTLSGPFTLVCWLILLVVLLVVILVVVVVALIGSAIGTQVGKATAGGSATPTTTQGSSPTPLAAGAYVTVIGNLVQSSTAMGANAFWFAGFIPNANGTLVDDATATNNNGTTVLGMSTGMAPFCFTDPDANIPGSMDRCMVPAAPPA